MPGVPDPARVFCCFFRAVPLLLFIVFLFFPSANSDPPLSMEQYMIPFRLQLPERRNFLTAPRKKNEIFSQLFVVAVRRTGMKKREKADEVHKKKDPPAKENLKADGKKYAVLRRVRNASILGGIQKKNRTPPSSTLKVRPRTCYDNAQKRPARCESTISPAYFTYSHKYFPAEESSAREAGGRGAYCRWMRSFS